MTLHSTRSARGAWERLAWRPGIRGLRLAAVIRHAHARAYWSRKPTVASQEADIVDFKPKEARSADQPKNGAISFS